MQTNSDREPRPRIRTVRDQLGRIRGPHATRHTDRRQALQEQLELLKN